MKRYNKHDVNPLLLGVYEKLKPWIPNHPDMRAYDKDGCKTCGSHDIQRRGFNVTKAGRKHRLHCQACGTWFEGAKAA